MALSLGSPPPEVIRHRISMEPGLSSPPADTQALAEQPSGLLTMAIRGFAGPTSSLRGYLPSPTSPAAKRHYIGKKGQGRRWPRGHPETEDLT